MKANTINIGGKVRPYVFGLNQSIEYCKHRNISITKMNEEIGKLMTNSGDGSEIRDLVWSALKDGARREGSEFDFTPETIADWMEVLSPDQMSDMVNNMAKSLIGVGGNAVKKKKVKSSQSKTYPIEQQK